MQTLGMVAAVVLPLWNIPLILRIRQRRSSKDVSIWWAVGVWVCLIAMLPAGLASVDSTFRLFSIINVISFSVVVVHVVRYRAT